MMINDELLKIAFTQYGVKEIVGAHDNPEVLKYFAQAGFDPKKMKDETAWCSAFMNWVVSKSTKSAERTMKLTARSWLNTGYEVKTPEAGDVVVLWRVDPTGWQGHVGLFINQNEKHIFVLGGNQDNQVNIKPYDKHRLLQYRRI